MTRKNADYAQLFACTADGVSVRGHRWLTVPDTDFGEIVRCTWCDIVRLHPAVTGEDLWPHGLYEIPNANAQKAGDEIVSDPHIMRTIGDACDAFRTAPGNRDGSDPATLRRNPDSRRHGPRGCRTVVPPQLSLHHRVPLDQFPRRSPATPLLTQGVRPQATFPDGDDYPAPSGYTACNLQQNPSPQEPSQ